MKSVPRDAIEKSNFLMTREDVTQISLVSARREFRPAR